MDLELTAIPPELHSLFLPQLEQLRAQAFPVPFGIAAALDGPIAAGWFWAFPVDHDCLVTTMHMVTRRAFVLRECPEIDYYVLGLLSGSDTSLINAMREERATQDRDDPFSGWFSPTLPRNALAFSMRAGMREFEMPAGSLHDSCNICMLPSFVERMQCQLGEDAPLLADAFARGTELNGSLQLLEAMRSLDPTAAALSGAPLHYRALVLEALAQMASFLADDEPAAVLHRTSIAAAVNAELVTSLAHPPALGELSQRLFIGRTLLCQQFREETGMSIGERMAQLRVQEAKRRLERSNETIAEIAHAVGYAQPGSFSTMFRRQTGMTPAQWRKQHRAG